MPPAAWSVAIVANAPSGRSARATLSTPTVGSIQWNAVKATTASNGSSGSGQSSNASTTTCAFGNAPRFRVATAARFAPSSTATTAATAFGEGHGGLPGPAPDLEDATPRADAGEREEVVEERIRVSRASAVVELGVFVEDRSQLVGHTTAAWQTARRTHLAYPVAAPGTLRHMLALVCPELGGEEVLRIEELPAPECGPGDVRIARARGVGELPRHARDPR